MRELDRVLEAMLFLSADPVPVPELADAARASEGEVVEYAEGDSLFAVFHRGAVTEPRR